MKIIYIEDNQLNYRLVTRMLKGETISGAATGKEGIELVLSEIPDVILLDINLPDMSGYATLKQLRSNPVSRDIPVIAVTANAMHGDRENILKAGFNGYVAKPLTRLELQNAVQSARNIRA